MASIDDVVGSWPDVLARLGTLERRTCPKLMSDLQETHESIRELQRHVGIDSGFSLRARRAYAEDRPMGNAAVASHRGVGSLPGPAPPPLPESVTAQLAEAAPLYRPPPSPQHMDFDALEAVESLPASVVLGAPEASHAIHSLRVPADLERRLEQLNTQHVELADKLETMAIHMNAEKAEAQRKVFSCEQNIKALESRFVILIDATTEVADTTIKIKEQLFQHYLQR